MNSTANPLALLVAQSRAFLSSSAVASFVGVILGLPGIIENTLVIAVLLRSRLFTKANHYFCMLNLAISQLLSALIVTCVGLKRCILFASGGNEVSTPLRCALDLEPNNFVDITVLFNTIAMGIDRLLGVAIPARYATINVTWLRAMNYAVWPIAFVIESIKVTGITTSQLLPVCLFALEYAPWAQSFYLYTMATFEIVLILVYVALVVVLQLNQRKVAGSGGNVSEARKAMNMRATQTALLIAAVFFVAIVVPGWVDALLGVVPGGQAILLYFTQWIVVIGLLPSMIDPMTYVWKNEKFREQLILGAKALAKKVCKWKNTTTVVPLRSERSSKRESNRLVASTAGKI